MLPQGARVTCYPGARVSHVTPGRPYHTGEAKMLIGRRYLFFACTTQGSSQRKSGQVRSRLSPAPQRTACSALRRPALYSLSCFARRRVTLSPTRTTSTSGLTQLPGHHLHEGPVGLVLLQCAEPAGELVDGRRQVVVLGALVPEQPHPVECDLRVHTRALRA